MHTDTLFVVRAVHDTVWVPMERFPISAGDNIACVGLCFLAAIGFVFIAFCVVKQIDS